MRARAPPAPINKKRVVSQRKQPKFECKGEIWQSESDWEGFLFTFGS